MVRGSAWLVVLLGLYGTVAACGGSSDSRRNGSSGSTSGAAGRGGAAGASGSGAGAGAGASAGSAGFGDAHGGSSGSAAGGTAGASTAGAPGGNAGLGGSGGGGVGGGTGGIAAHAGLASGGRAGGAENAGEQAGGADNGGSNACLDLCKEEAPACCTEGLRCVSAVPTCHIDVLDGDVALSYEYAELEQQIAALPGDVLMSIPAAAVAVAAAEAPAASRFELTLSAQGTELYAAGLKTFYNQPFRVLCADETLFVGVFYMRGGAAALITPVIHVEQEEDGPVRLLLGAEQGAWTSWGTAYVGQAEKERIDRPELRAAFCSRGILGELEAL